MENKGYGKFWGANKVCYGGGGGVQVCYGGVCKCVMGGYTSVLWGGLQVCYGGGVQVVYGKFSVRFVTY